MIEIKESVGIWKVYRDGALQARFLSREAAEQYVRQMGWGVRLVCKRCEKVAP
jgi:hypothetical protein